MLKAVVIRPAGLADVSAMCGLLAELFSLERDFSPAVERQERGLKLLLREHQALVLVAEAGGQVVGMVTLQTLISTAQGGRVGLVEDLVIAAGWRAAGLGSRLLAAILEQAAHQGLTRVQLLVDEDNQAAKGFYRSQGLKRTHLRTWRQMLD